MRRARLRRAQPAVDPVAMEQRAAGPLSAWRRTTSSNSLARQVAIRPGPPHRFEEQLLVPRPGHALGDDLLGEDVEGTRAAAPCGRGATRGRSAQRGGLDQLVEGQREHPALGHAAQRVAGTADALEKRGDGPRRAHLDDEVHVADVDARARATRWRPARAACPPSAAARPPAGARATGCRGGSSPRPRPGACVSWAAMRSAIFRVLTKTRVVRCPRTSSASRA